MLKKLGVKNVKVYTFTRTYEVSLLRRQILCKVCTLMFTLIFCLRDP